MMYKRNVLLLPLAVCLLISVQAQQIITDQPQPGSLEIASANYSAIICTDPTDFDLIRRSASWLQQDIEKVTGKKLSIANALPSSAKTIIVIGTIEKSLFIQQLIKQKKLNVDKIKNKWDAYL